MVTMDAEALVTLEGVSNPAYDGLQTGVFPLSLVKGSVQDVERLWIWSKDNGYINGLYEASSERLHWIRPDAGIHAVESKLETRRFSFDTPFDLKEIKGADIWLAELSDEVSIELLFRPDEWRAWIPWKTALLKPTTQGESVNGPQEVVRQDRARLEFGEPPNVPCLGRKQLANRCFHIQCLIKWSGHLRIDQFRVHGYKTDETMTCDENDTVSILRTTDDRQYDYEYEMGNSGEGSWQRTT